MLDRNRVARSAALLLLSASPLGLGVAHAQSTDAGGGEVVEEVVVTGSRLSSAGFKAPSPVTVVSAEEFKVSGAQNVESLLVQSPQFLGNLFSAAGNGQNQGVAALNLRGLGERRSLTLVNGRRYTITGTSGLTDLNTIPTALVKRVEVVTGGSSSVYGSDALAGVVNFILRDDFKGVELTAQRSWDEHTWTPTSSVDLTLGGNFADNKGNAVVSVDYYDRGPITRGQFAYTSTQLNDGCVTAASFSNTAAGVPLAVPGGQTCTTAGGRAGFVAANSATIPGGRFTGVPLFGSAQSNPGLNAALQAAGLQNLTSFGFTFDPASTAARPALDPADRYNNTPFNFMQTPLRRWMINSFAHYDVNRHATAYVEAHYSNYVSDVQIAPLAFSNNILVDVNNPYLSPAMQEVLHQLDLAETRTTTVSAGLSSYTNAPNDGRAVLSSNRRLAEGGPALGRSERNVFRTALGLRGDITDRLKYDIYYSFASTTLDEEQYTAISRSRFQQALLSQGGAAPLLNIFGPNISPQAYAAISVPAANKTSNEQQVAAGAVTGSLFDLPAGPVDFSTGFEWRYNKLSVQPDAMGAIGETVSAIGTPSAVKGSTTVKELYGEVRVPILTNAPFAERLALNGAARYSKYDTEGVGGVWTYSVGLQWQPVSDATFRIQKQRAIRAPGIDELFGPQTAGTPVVNDPCSSRVAPSAQTPEVRALCVATGVPAANVFTSVVQPNAQVGTLNGGNPRVGQETADTLTVGVVYTPSQIPGLALSLDWYKIKLDGAIAPLGGSIQNTFDLCYNILKDANSAYCKAMHRDPSTGELTSNNMTDPYYVDQFLANTGGIEVSGVDFNAQYGFNIDYSPLGGDSRIDLSTSWSYTSKYTFTPVQDLALTNECVGSFGAICGAPAPKWKGTSRLSWRTGPLTLSLRHRYTGPVTRDLYVVPKRRGLTPPAKSDITAAEIHGVHYFDLSVSAELPHETTVSGGINNLFNKDAPLLGSGAQTWGVNTAPGVYDIYGRNFFVSVTKRF